MRQSLVLLLWASVVYNKRMKIIGHRGAKGLAPENTLVSCQQAIKAGADWIELDVRLTKDGQVAVLHDRSLWRVTGNVRAVRRYTLTQLRHMRTKSGEPIASLSEVIELARGRIGLNIELKEVEAIPAVLAELSRQAPAPEHILISSFKHRALRAARQLHPTVPLALLQRVRPRAFTKLDNLNLTAVGFFWLWAPTFAVAAAKSRGLWTYAYMVDYRGPATWLARRGVDGIVTNVPGKLRPFWAVALVWALGFAVALLLFSFLR